MHLSEEAHKKKDKIKRVPDRRRPASLYRKAVMNLDDDGEKRGAVSSSSSGGVLPWADPQTLYAQNTPRQGVRGFPVPESSYLGAREYFVPESPYLGRGGYFALRSPAPQSLLPVHSDVHKLLSRFGTTPRKEDNEQKASSSSSSSSSSFGSGFTWLNSPGLFSPYASQQGLGSPHEMLKFHVSESPWNSSTSSVYNRGGSSLSSFSATPRREENDFIPDEAVFEESTLVTAAASTGMWGINTTALTEEQGELAQAPRIEFEPTSLEQALEAECTDTWRPVFQRWWDFCKENLIARNEDGSYVRSTIEILVKQTGTATNSSRAKTRARKVMHATDLVASKREEGASLISAAVSTARVPFIPISEELIRATVALFDVARAHPRSFIVGGALSPEFLFYVLGFALSRSNAAQTNRYEVPREYEGRAVSSISSWDMYNYHHLFDTLKRMVIIYYPTTDESVANTDVSRVLFLCGFGYSGSVNPLIMRLIVSYGQLHADLDVIENARPVELPNEYVAYDSKKKETVKTQFGMNTIEKKHADVRTVAKNRSIQGFSAISLGTVFSTATQNRRPDRDDETVLFSVEQLRFHKVPQTENMVTALEFSLDGKNKKSGKTTSIARAMRSWTNARVPIVHAHMQQVSQPAPRFYVEQKADLTHARDEWTFYDMLTNTEQGDVRMTASYVYFSLTSKAIWRVRPLSMAAAQNIIVSSSKAVIGANSESVDGFDVDVNIFSQTTVAVSHHTFISDSVLLSGRQARSFFVRSLYGHMPNAHFMNSQGFVSTPGDAARLFNERLLKPFGGSLGIGVNTPVYPMTEFKHALAKLRSMRRLIVAFLPTHFQGYRFKNEENVKARLLPIAAVQVNGKAPEELVTRDGFFALVDYYMRLGDALFMDPNARTYWGKFLVPHTVTLRWPASLQASYFYMVEALLSPTIFAPFFYEPTVISNASIRALNSLLSGMYKTQKSLMGKVGTIPSTWKSAAHAFSTHIESGTFVPLMHEFTVLSCRTYKHQLFFQRAEEIWKNGTSFALHNAMFATIVEPEVNDTIFEKINTATQKPFKFCNLDYLARPYERWAANVARAKARNHPEEGDGELEGTDNPDETPEERKTRLWKQREDQVDPQEFPLLLNKPYVVLAERAIAMLAPDWSSNSGRDDPRVHPENLPSFFSALFQYACLTPEELTAYSFGPIHHKRGVGVWHPTAAFDQSVENMKLVSDSTIPEKWGAQVFYALMAAPWRLRTADDEEHTFGKTTEAYDSSLFSGLVPRKNLYNTANFLAARSNGVKGDISGSSKSSKKSGDPRAHFDSRVSAYPAMIENMLRVNVTACYPAFPSHTYALGAGFKQLAETRFRAAKTAEEKKLITRDLFPVPIVSREGRGINRLPSLSKNDVPVFVALFREGDEPDDEPYTPTPTVLTAILSSIRSDPVRTTLYRSTFGLVPEETATVVLHDMQFSFDPAGTPESNNGGSDEGSETEDEAEDDEEPRGTDENRGKKRRAEAPPSDAQSFSSGSSRQVETTSYASDDEWR